MEPVQDIMAEERIVEKLKELYCIYKGSEYGIALLCAIKKYEQKDTEALD